MYLKTIYINGFKSFARTTEIALGRELTAIVGPNGAGKSNILDAVRWCLGEQSLKAIRGKKSTDVLFAGSSGRARASFAEVSLVLDNDDHALPVDFDELAITRRLHRDGESEYLLGGKPVRLHDITLLLAQANFGQKSYSIVSQGMVDHVISATPAERLQFFIEATGVRQYQLRRDEAVGKLTLTDANLQEANSRLTELTPILNSLTRQVKRLQKREQLAAELAAWQRTYYWHRRQTSHAEQVILYRRLGEAEATQLAQRTAVRQAKAALNESTATASRTELFAELQASYAAALAKRDEELKRAAVSAAETALDEAVAPLAATPDVNLAGVIKTLRHIHGQLLAPTVKIEQLSKNLAEVIADLERLESRGVGDQRQTLKAVQKSFQKKLTSDGTQRPGLTPSPALQAAEVALRRAAESLTSAHQQAQANEEQRAAAQTKLQGATEHLAQADAEVAAVQVDIARWQAQAEDLASEVRRELQQPLDALANDLNLTKAEHGGPPTWEEKIQRLKEQVAQAGGIDPEITDEYEQVKQRHDFLRNQTEDLTKAMAELQKIVKELDKIIERQFHENFKKINDQFGHFFKTLFGGGHATLELMTTPDVEEPPIGTGEALPRPAINNPLANVGIAIEAVLPGKKMNTVHALSGGERSLLATALLCAIVACNPSPFVIMDEVDAALDEANAERLANIFQELNKHTQIIIITHNRVIMQHADVLYGVTMGPDGDSRVLSLSLKDAERVAA